MPNRRRLTVNPIFAGIDPKNPIANAANRKKYPWLEKIAQDMRIAAGRAAAAGADAMRDKILNSPTGSSWHIAINIERGKRPPNINQWGSRYETGTMFNLVSANRGKIVENADRRRRGSVTAGFGWPAMSDGTIKDAPSSPVGRAPDGPGWRTDPKYFLMQEYGFNNMGDQVEGMYSQQAGVEAAKLVLNNELRKMGYK